MQQSSQTITTEEVNEGFQWETVACDLCHSTEVEKLLDGIDWEFGVQEGFRLVQCKACGLIYLNPRPALSSIPLIYPPTYSNFRKSEGLRRLLKFAYYKLTAPYPYLKDIKPGRILDVGCATGHTNYPYGENGSLRQLKQQGWHVSGLELNKDAAEVARSHGITIYLGRLSDITSIDERFDVIRFNHVLEHSVSPIDDLSSAAALLNENGRIIVSGPNIDSAAFFLFQKYWSGLDLPRHFYHFTPVTLRKYCEDAQLQIHSEYHDGRPFDFIHSLTHFLQSRELTGRNGTCQGSKETRENSVARLFSPLSRICLHVAVKTLTDFFNRIGKSDSYTIIAMHRPQKK